LEIDFVSVSLPDYLIPFQQEAEKAIANGLVKDIEFSGPTYQILIEDPASHEEFWVFLQLKHQGELKDAFCSKEEIHDTIGCLHLAIAYLSLFDKSEHPLHERFNRSLWNNLFKIGEINLDPVGEVGFSVLERDRIGFTSFLFFHEPFCDVAPE